MKYLMNIALGAVLLVFAYCLNVIYGNGLIGFAALMVFTFMGIVVDVIWCPPKVKHWHGASPTTAMTHIAITGTINGKNVEWMEKVTEEQYKGKGGSNYER